jgi:hypothetical protein
VKKPDLKTGNTFILMPDQNLIKLVDANGEKNGLQYDLKKDTRKLDPGLTFEAGFEFPVSSHAIRTSLKYEVSMIDASKTSEDLHHKMAGLNIAYFF